MLSNDQLATLLEAQNRLDAAHRSETVAIYGHAPRGMKYADVPAWREAQKVTAAAELQEAERYMQLCLRKFNVTEHQWHGGLRRVAMRMNPT